MTMTTTTTTTMTTTTTTTMTTMTTTGDADDDDTGGEVFQTQAFAATYGSRGAAGARAFVACDGRT